MFSFENNIVAQQIEQRDKEHYIADMLLHTLFANNVNISECNRIVELLKEKLQSANNY